MSRGISQSPGMNNPRASKSGVSRFRRTFTPSAGFSLAMSSPSLSAPIEARIARGMVSIASRERGGKTRATTATMTEAYVPARKRV